MRCEECQRIGKKLSPALQSLFVTLIQVQSAAIAEFIEGDVARTVSAASGRLVFFRMWMSRAPTPGWDRDAHFGMRFDAVVMTLANRKAARIEAHADPEWAGIFAWEDPEDGDEPDAFP